MCCVTIHSVFSDFHLCASNFAPTASQWWVSGHFGPALLCDGTKFLDFSRDHTFIETETVRHVYFSMESLFLVVNRSSNILRDLESLRLLAKVFPLSQPSEVWCYFFVCTFQLSLEGDHFQQFRSHGHQVYCTICSHIFHSGNTLLVPVVVSPFRSHVSILVLATLHPWPLKTGAGDLRCVAPIAPRISPRWQQHRTHVFRSHSIRCVAVQLLEVLHHHFAPVVADFRCVASRCHSGAFLQSTCWWWISGLWCRCCVLFSCSLEPGICL